MDLYAARTHLGLPERFDRDTARRAYLRQVKVCKPERDPDGFARTRAAWEAVDEALRERPWVFGQAAEADDDDWITAPAPQPNQAQAVELAAQHQIFIRDLDALLGELDAEDAGAGADVATDAADEVAEPLPELAAFPHGPPPPQPPPAADPRIELARLRSVFERGLGDRPVVHAYELSRALDAARDLPDAPRPQVLRCVQGIGDLLRQGHRASAERLARALAGWIDAHGGELKVFRSTESMLRWQVTRETAVAAKNLQRPVFELLLQAEQLSKADLQPVVDRWLDQHLDRVPVALLMLRMHCPVAAQTLVAALQKGWDQRRPGQVALPLSAPTQPWRLPVPPPRRHQGDSWGAIALIAVIMVAIGALAGMAGKSQSRTQRGISAVDYLPHYRPQVPNLDHLFRDLYVPPTPVTIPDLALRYPLQPWRPVANAPVLTPWHAAAGWPSDLPDGCGTAPAKGEAAARHVRKAVAALAESAQSATATALRAQGNKVATALRLGRCQLAAWETATLLGALHGDPDAVEKAALSSPAGGEPGCALVAAVQACRRGLPTNKSDK